MKQLALIVAIALCQPALAETWLCIPEASAAVTQSAPFGSGLVADTDAKYLFTVNEQTNQVEVKPHGGKPWLLDCSNTSFSIHCELPGNDFGSEFALDKKASTFWSFGISPDLDTGRQLIFVEAGSCSTL